MILSPEQEVRALSLHNNSIIVDGHCDTILDVIDGKRRLGEESSSGHLDFPRMVRSGVNVQFFAAFIESVYKPDRALKRGLQLIEALHREIEAYGEQVCLVTNYAEVKQALSQGRIAAFLSIEGGEALDGDLSVLNIYHRLGVRSITLTWNQRNQIADGVGEDRTRGGLTRFGVEVIKEMNRLGMLVDVSHLSEAGFWDVIKVSEQPIAATHSNAFAVCPHIRNLKDEQIRVLDAKGGVMGMNFCPDFISQEGADLDKLLDHIDYISNLVGSQVIALGSDFDGIDTAPKGLEDVTKMPGLTRGLVMRGYGDKEIEGILGGNFLRVIKEVMGGPTS